MDAIVYDKVGKEAEKVRDALYGIYPQETITDATIASFDDGADGIPVKALTVGIEPVQDLHGYDKPWPGGGGVNKWDFLHPVSVQNATVTENSDGTFVAAGSTASAFLRYLVPVTANKRHILFCSKSNEIGNTAVLGLVNVFDGSDSSAAPLLTNALIADSAKAITPTGDYIFIVFTVTGGAGSGSATVSQPFIIAADEGIPAYSPYSNICPISGWTGAEVTRTGKNLIDPETKTKPVVNGRAVFQHDDPLFLKKGITYTLTFFGMTSNPDGLYFTRNDGGEGRGFYNVSSATYTPLEDGLFYFWGLWNQGQSTSVYENTVAVLIVGNTPATEYIPYTGNQVSVNWEDEAGTVYGGTLTLNPDRTGQLVVDRAMADLGTLTWIYDTQLTYPRFKSPVLQNSAPNSALISSMYKDDPSPITNTGVDGTAKIYGAQSPRIYINNFSYTDAASFKTAMSGVQLVYKLASPTTFQLTAEQVSGILTTLYGTNNIWADTGNIEKLTYHADLGKYIDSHITTAVANALNA